MIQWTPILNYNWENVKQDSKNLAANIWIWKFKFILAISKWGLIPVYFLADELGIKIVKTICLSSYKNGNVQWPVIQHKVAGFLEEIKNPRDWLVVDDLSDSWFTLEYIKKEYPAIKTAVLLQKKTWWIKADYYAKEIDNIWVKFPWEV